MGEEIRYKKFPKWLRRAVRFQVLTFLEAEILLSVQEMAPAWSEVPLPTCLYPAAERMYLFEIPAQGVMQ